MKVYTEGGEIWAVMSEDREPLDCDADGDFVARVTP